MKKVKFLILATFIMGCSTIQKTQIVHEPVVNTLNKYYDQFRNKQITCKEYLELLQEQFLVLNTEKLNFEAMNDKSVDWDEEYRRVQFDIDFWIIKFIIEKNKKCQIF